MRNIARIAPVFVGLMLSTPAALDVKSAPPGDDKVRFSCSLESAELTLGEPIVLDMSLQNASGELVQLDLRKDCKDNFLFVITGPDGTAISPPPLASQGLTRVGLVPVEPGRTYKQKLLLNEWTGFPKAGTYLIDVRLSSRPEPGSSAAAYEFPPSRLELQVHPRDPGRLESLCLSLALGVEQASSFEEADWNARTLSYVRDPVAVPYLERVLRTPWFVEPFAIDGLAAIGNAPAVRVLVSALNIDAPRM